MVEINPENFSVSGKYTVGSMFAGIGGICLAFKNAGAEIIWANEIDHLACETYRHNFGNSYLVEADIKTIGVEDIPKMDILTAGFPCQAFSIAGYRKGFDDERGVLFFEVMRVICEKKPRAVFLENVKNLVTHDKGRTLKNIETCLNEEKYVFDYKVLNTTEYGNIPQNRERIYIVAFREQTDLDNFSFPSPTKLEKNIHDIIPMGRRQKDEYYYSKEHMYYSKLDAAIKNPDTVYQWRRTYVRENKNNNCPTLTANMGMGGHNVPIIRDNYGIRKLTPEECLMFQGFPDNFKFPEMRNSAKYKQAGNSVSITVVERIAENMIKAMKITDETKCEKNLSEKNVS